MHRYAWKVRRSYVELSVWRFGFCGQLKLIDSFIYPGHFFLDSFSLIRSVSLPFLITVDRTHTIRFNLSGCNMFIVQKLNAFNRCKYCIRNELFRPNWFGWLLLEWYISYRGKKIVANCICPLMQYTRIIRISISFKSFACVCISLILAFVVCYLK